MDRRMRRFGRLEVQWQQADGSSVDDPTTMFTTLQRRFYRSKEIAAAIWR
jgi:hypothetical protein